MSVVKIMGTHFPILDRSTGDHCRNWKETCS